MPIRVALVGTGNCGQLALIQLIEDPRFDLVAVGTSTEDKVGVDAGALAGLDVVTGVDRDTGPGRRAGHQAGLPGLLRHGRHPPHRGDRAM